MAFYKTYARSLTFAAVVAWIAVNTVVAAGGVAFIPVPLVGYVRWDVAILFLGIEIILVAGDCVCCPRVLRFSVVALWLMRYVYCQIWDPTILHGRLDMDGLTGQTRRAAFYEPDVTVLHNALPVEVVDEIARSAWRNVDLWTKQSNAFVLGAFVFGGSTNFDDGYDNYDAPWWSLTNGFKWNLGYQTLFELESTHREKVRHVIKEELRWVSDALRKSLALSLRVEPDQIVFGGEGSIKSLNHPAFTIALPNFFWHIHMNHHADPFGLVKHANGTSCNTKDVRAWVWPIRTQPGAGLLSWTSGKDGPEVHEDFYERGSLYSWPGRLVHAIRPQPYRDWDLTPRMTIQAFGVRCGKEWYVYH